MDTWQPARVNPPQCYPILVCIQRFYFVTISNINQECLLVVHTDLSEFNSLHVVGQ